MPTIGDALYQSSCQLKDAGIGSGSLEASLLLARATGFDRLQLIVNTGETVSAPHWESFNELMERRLNREPIQYILGETEFMGLSMMVSPAVLIPRPDTEILVEAVLDLQEARQDAANVTVADIGTGSGAIAVALAKSWPNARLIASDISETALAIAHANAKCHDVQAQIDFRLGDGLSVLKTPVDYLVSNPPYIAPEDLHELEPEVRDYEPHLALTPGLDAYRWYRLFATDGARVVVPGGYLAVEVGIGQAEGVVAILEAAGHWETPQVIDDLGRIQRVIVAQRRH
jgi:release factor glutamine methyltransferase